jgi:hypothetical protein
MAASHSLRLDTGSASVEMLLKRIVLHKIGRFHFRTTLPTITGLQQFVTLGITEHNDFKI